MTYTTPQDLAEMTQVPGTSIFSLIVMPSDLTGWTRTLASSGAVCYSRDEFVLLPLSDEWAVKLSRPAAPTQATEWFFSGG